MEVTALGFIPLSLLFNKKKKKKGQSYNVHELHTAVGKILYLCELPLSHVMV